jgi:phosphinothricin acetyltransferase
MMTIRPAEERDLESILDIMNDSILHSTANYFYDVRSSEYINGWFKEKRAENTPVLVSDLKGNVVGYATYSIFRPRDAYKFSAEHSIYIHQDFRNKGIGSQLMGSIIEAAKAQNFHTLIAGIDADNKGSINFHKKFGFEEVAHFHEVGFKFDRWLDLIFMQLFLNRP